MSENLKIGDRVYYMADYTRKGRIIAVNEYGYNIRWDEAVVRNIYVTSENKYIVRKAHNQKQVFIFR